jgi:hypothetical protein
MTHKYYTPPYKIRRPGDLAPGIYAPLRKAVMSGPYLGIFTLKKT